MADPGISNSGTKKLFGSGDWFEAPSHLPDAFVVRIWNITHTILSL